MATGVTLSIPDRVVLVTGGSRGIGAATVRMFVAAGAKVVFNYQKARDAADRLMAELGPVRCHGVQMDLNTAESADALVKAAVDRFGRLDAAVINHGIWPAEDIPVSEMSYEHWHRTISINLDSTFGLVKNAVAQMKKQGLEVVEVQEMKGWEAAAKNANAVVRGGVVPADLYDRAS